MAADDSWEPEIWVPPSQVSPSTPLFHYTTAAGLLGLVTNGCLWATEASGLNDRAEVRRGRAIVARWLKDNTEGNILETLEDALQADGWKSRAFDQTVGDVMVLSASRSGDDANQWRLYGGGGRGYCVGLDPDPLSVASTLEPYEDPPPLGVTAWSGPGVPA